MKYTDSIIHTSQLLKQNGIKNLQYDTMGKLFNKSPRGVTSPYTGLNTSLFNQKIKPTGGGYSFNLMY